MKTMTIRFSSIFSSLFFFLCSLSLVAQTGAVIRDAVTGQENIRLNDQYLGAIPYSPEVGAHVPNEVIIHFNRAIPGNMLKKRLIDWVTKVEKGKPSQKALSIDLQPISFLKSTAATDFLVKFNNGFPGDLDICDIIDPNEGTTRAVRGDGSWPNYITSSGVLLGDMGSDRICYAADAGQLEPGEDGEVDFDLISTYDPLDGCAVNYSVADEDNGYGAVRVAVLDSGVDPALHPATFRGSVFQAAGNDGITDDYGHGTAVAGIIAQGLWDDAGGIGNVVIESHRVLRNNGEGTLADLIPVLENIVAENRVDIVNMSFGFSPLGCAKGEVDIIVDLLGQADRQGIVLVSSAGNAGRNLDGTPQYPAAVTGLEHAVTVGSVICDGIGIAPFSNRSLEHVDILASGENILVPNYRNGCFINVPGTSFSAPIITQVIANWFSQGHDIDELDCLFYENSYDVESTRSSSGYRVIHTPQNRLCGGIIPDDGSVVFEGLTAPGGSTTTGAGILAVYPNPFTSEFSVSAKTEDGKATAATVMLMDSNGRRLKVSSSSVGATTVTANDLKPGLYWLTVQTATGVETRMVTKL